MSDAPNMRDKPDPSLRIRRNYDGTFSVIDTREGIRLLKAGFTSYAGAKQWLQDVRLKHGTMKPKPDE
jgi:hypothetical protein